MFALLYSIAYVIYKKVTMAISPCKHTHDEWTSLKLVNFYSPSFTYSVGEQFKGSSDLEDPVN